jgi:hypothetical protein
MVWHQTLDSVIVLLQTGYVLTGNTICQRRGEPTMSEKQLKNLEELSRSIRENSARVENELSNGSTKADPAVIISAAKYRKALELLANE